MRNYPGEVDRALWFLKTRGPQPLTVIAAELKITTEGARFQLLKLASEGLVEARNESKGRGRPQQIWSLTEAGQGRFPDTHAELTVKLILKMKETLGQSALDAVIAASTKDNVEKYTSELEQHADLESRVKALAAIRDREGYMAEYRREEEGFLLIENHCPICAAATICQNFCKSELETFQAALGENIQVKRVDHIVSGARRCAYSIIPLAPEK